MMRSIYKSLRNHNGFLRYFKNTNWMLLDRFIQLSVSFFVGIYVVRYLGPERYGVLTYSISLVSLVTPFFKLGLHPVLNKEFIQKEESSDKLFGTSLLIQALAFFVVLFIFMLFLWLSNMSGEELWVLIILFFGNFFLVFGIYEQYLNANLKSKYVSYSNGVVTVLSSLSKIGLIVFEKELIFFAIVAVFETMIKYVLLHFFLTNKMKIHVRNWCFELKLLKKMVKESWPFILTGMMVGLYMKIDQVMIKNIMGNEALGYYSIAVKLSELWSVIPIIVSQSLFPAILNAHKSNENLFNLRIKRLYLFNIIMAIFIIALLTFFSEEIVLLLFGESYRQTSNILSMYAWAILFIFLGLATEKWMFTNKLQKLSLYNKTLAVGVNISLNYVLIPRIGLEGATIATIISYACSVVVFPIIWSESRKNIMLVLTCWKIR